MEPLNHPADLPAGGAINQLNLRAGLFESVPAAIQDRDLVFVSATLLGPGIDHTAASIAACRSLIVFEVDTITQDNFVMSFICAFDADAIVAQMDLKFGTKIMIPHPAKLFELDDLFKHLFQNEIAAFNKSQHPAPGQAAGGGPPTHPHATSQQQHHAIIEKIQHLLTDANVAIGYPTAIPGEAVTADKLQMPMLEAHLRHLISESGQMTNEKILTTLSSTQLRAILTLDFNGTSLSLTDLISSELLNSFSTLERIFLIGRVITKIYGQIFSMRFSISLSWWFEQNIRDVCTFNTEKLNSTSLLPLIEMKLFTLRSLVPPPTPLGVDENTHMINVYKDHLRFTLEDRHIQFLLHSSAPIVSSAGGGYASTTASVSTVGSRRKGTPGPAPPPKRQSSRYDDWMHNSPLPNARVCWDWVLKKAPCSNAFCKNTRKRDHHYPQGTKKSEQDAFVAWLGKKP